jgi:hypothetical protein
MSDTITQKLIVAIENQKAYVSPRALDLPQALGPF